MKTKHTEGPWKVEHFISQFEATVSSDSGLRICEVKSFSGKKFNDPPREERDANAKLIAAAPEMLAALIKERDVAKLMGTGNLTELNRIIKLATE